MKNMSSNAVLVVVGFILSLLLTNCASSGKGHGRRVDETKLALIVDGKTVKKEVLEIFGKPDNISTQASYYFYLYNYCLLDPSGKTTAFICNSLQITFDKKTDTVRRHRYHKGLNEENSPDKKR
jgi:outer membrane protein assembly factor BamE (lipoprotein component of BamABCDE complex)